MIMQSRCSVKGSSVVMYEKSGNRLDKNSIVKQCNTTKLQMRASLNFSPIIRVAHVHATVQHDVLSTRRGQSHLGNEVRRDLWREGDRIVQHPDQHQDESHVHIVLRLSLTGYQPHTADLSFFSSTCTVAHDLKVSHSFFLLFHQHSFCTLCNM